MQNFEETPEPGTPSISELGLIGMDREKILQVCREKADCRQRIMVQNDTGFLK